HDPPSAPELKPPPSLFRHPSRGHRPTQHSLVLRASFHMHVVPECRNHNKPALPIAAIASCPPVGGFQLPVFSSVPASWRYSHWLKWAPPSFAPTPEFHPPRHLLRRIQK